MKLCVLSGEPAKANSSKMVTITRTQFTDRTKASIIIGVAGRFAKSTASLPLLFDFFSEADWT
jgi:hypothetical protein